MGCEHNLVECQELMILGRRFVVEDVETRRGDPPFGQSGRQRSLVHDSAARGVDDDGARPKTRELLCGQDRSASLRRVERNDTSPGHPIQ